LRKNTRPKRKEKVIEVRLAKNKKDSFKLITIRNSILSFRAIEVIKRTLVT
jgi:hypothetical protein